MLQTPYSVRFARWDWDYFLCERKKVLQLWPTGAEIASEDALAAAVSYHKQQPWYKFAALRNARAEAENEFRSRRKSAMRSLSTRSSTSAVRKISSPTAGTC